MAFASAGASTPFITSTPSNAVTLLLLIADVGFRVAGLGAGSAALLALVPGPLFAETASSDPAMTGAVPTIVSNDMHNHFLDFDIELGLSFFAKFRIVGTGTTFRQDCGAGPNRYEVQAVARQPDPATAGPVRLPHHQTGERKYIGLEGHHNSHQGR